MVSVPASGGVSGTVAGTLLQTGATVYATSPAVALSADGDLVLLYSACFDLVAGAQILSPRFPVPAADGSLPYGPVIAPAEVRDDVCHALCGALSDIPRQRMRMLFVQPPDGAQDISSELLKRGFRSSSAEVAPSGSLRIDLAADDGSSPDSSPWCTSPE